MFFAVEKTKLDMIPANLPVQKMAMYSPQA